MNSKTLNLFLESDLNFILNNFSASETNHSTKIEILQCQTIVIKSFKIIHYVFSSFTLPNLKTQCYIFSFGP